MASSSSSNLVATLEHVQGTTFKMTVTNKGESDVSVCTYYSPLEGGIRNKRVVKVVDVETGEELPYTGMMAKRMPPSADDYIDIAAGDAVSVEFSLGRAAEVQAGKQYRLELGRPHTVLPGKAKSLFGSVDGHAHHLDASVIFTA